MFATRDYGLRPRRVRRNPHLGMRGRNRCPAQKVCARLDGHQGEREFNVETLLHKRPDGLVEPNHTIRFVSEIPGKSDRTAQSLDMLGEVDKSGKF